MAEEEAMKTRLMGTPARAASATALRPQMISWPSGTSKRRRIFSSCLARVGRAARASARALARALGWPTRFSALGVGPLPSSP